MAESPAHKFGQAIGNLLEGLTEPKLQEFCQTRGLYLDRQGHRPGARKGKKVSWDDKYGNSHDLDFVIERDGDISERGKPVAFIEAAWRRYTKHSRNKAQEIQGAVLPIAEKYEWDKPFLGAVLAGVFTEGSREQLTSVGFNVVYIAYEDIVEAFGEVGIDVRFDEKTADSVFSDTVEKMEALPSKDWQRVKDKIYELNRSEFENFFGQLSSVLDRVLDHITVVPLHGTEEQFRHVQDAMDFIDQYDESNHSGEFQKYEVIVRYSNGDKIDAQFSRKDKVRRFLAYAAG